MVLSKIKEKIKKFFRKGSSSVLIYLATVIVLIAACTTFVDYCMVYIDAENAQLIVDVAADGGAVAGDNYWSLDEKKAKKAITDLTKANNRLLKKRDVKATSKLNSSDSDIKHGKVKVQTSAVKKSTYKVGSVTATADSQTKVLYSGGRAVVMLAYKHSIDYYNKINNNGPHPLYGSGFKYTRYVWAAGRSWNPQNMPYYADCSGFVYAIFGKFNKYIGTWTGEMEHVGREVSADEARAGDIVLYFGADGSSTHVGIYVGEKGGRRYQIDCGGGGSSNSYANPGTGVRLRTVAAAAGGRTAKYRRVIQDSGEAYEVPQATDFDSIVYILREAGYSKAAIAGILGNWACESGISPIVREGHPSPTDPYNTNYAKQIQSGNISRHEFIYIDTQSHAGGEGYGLAQWTTIFEPAKYADPEHDRKAQLWDFCRNLDDSQYPVSVTTTYGQLMFAIHEFNTTRPLPSSYKKIQDPVEAATIFMNVYEGIVDDSLAKRQNMATHYYNKM